MAEATLIFGEAIQEGPVEVCDDCCLLMGQLAANDVDPLLREWGRRTLAVLAASRSGSSVQRLQ